MSVAGHFFSVSHSRAVLTRTRLWPPLWSTRRQQAHFQNGNMFFLLQHLPTSRKTVFFPDIPHASNWLATILGAFFSSLPTMRFFLSVHPCEAHFESLGLQASVDTFDSESGGIIFSCQKVVATNFGHYLVTDLNSTKALSLRRTLCRRKFRGSIRGNNSCTSISFEHCVDANNL